VLSIHVSEAWTQATWRMPDDLLAHTKAAIDSAGREDQPAAVLAGPARQARSRGSRTAQRPGTGCRGAIDRSIIS